MTLKVAVIGAGYFSNFHCAAWARMPEVTLTALTGLEPDAVASLADTHHIPGRYTNIDAMLTQVNPQIVDIVSPSNTHFDIIERAVATGAAIQCQKPFCTSLAQAKKAVELAEKNQTVLAVHENFRFQPWHRQIKTMLDQGILGDVYQATFRLRPGDGQGPGAYLARQPYFQQMPRFLVHETAIHQIDVFRYFFGEPNGVFARLTQLNPAISGEDAGIILFEFPNGPRALFDGNRLVDHAAQDTRRTMGEMIIEGSDKTLTLDGDARIWLRKHGETKTTEIEYSWNDTDFGGDCVYRTNRAFLDHVIDGAPLENAAKDYIHNLALEDLIYKSNTERRWLDLRSVF